MTWKITHTPFTTGEPYDVATGLEIDEAKVRLGDRAKRMAVKFPECEIDWDQPVGMGYELTDDTAYMIGDYQGRTQIVREED